MAAGADRRAARRARASCFLRSIAAFCSADMLAWLAWLGCDRGAGAATAGPGAVCPGHETECASAGARECDTPNFLNEGPLHPPFLKLKHLERRTKKKQESKRKKKGTKEGRKERKKA